MQKFKTSACLTGMFILLGSAQAQALDCDEMRNAVAADTDIVSAEWIDAGPDSDAKTELPRYCRVTGIVGKRLGVGDVPFGAKFDLRLPQDWNGRFYFQGGGGLDGQVRPAVGSGQPPGQLPALAAGYAVVSTDAGHEDKDASFGLDQKARTDWGYQAVHDVTVVAKALITKFYGNSPSFSYLIGCSNGGRQAMMASQRYPDMFDGLVAGAPVFRMSRSHIDTAYGFQQLTSIAPKTTDGAPVISRAFNDAELRTIADGILAACDGSDGLEDGMVQPKPTCDFKPQTLICEGEKSDACLTKGQADVLEAIHAGSRNAAGEPYYVPWPWDPGIASENWRSWRLGRSETAVPDAIKAGLSNNGIKHVFLTPPQPDFDLLDFDLETDPERMEASADFADAVSTDLDAFRAGGGKILMYHGMADPATSARDPMRYMDAVTDRYGDATSDFARLFLAPGVGHCRGGNGLDSFDVLSAIVDWTENGNAPEQIITEGKAMPGRTRPLCPYPMVATYSGAGSIDDAANFTCQ